MLNFMHMHILYTTISYYNTCAKSIIRTLACILYNNYILGELLFDAQEIQGFQCEVTNVCTHAGIELFLSV